MGRPSDELYTTRSFAAGAFDFAVATNHVDDRLRVESLFRDLRPGASAGSQTTVFSLFRLDPDERAWVVSGALLKDVPASTFGAALVNLMGAINRCALDAEPEYLHLHAAAATREGRVVVIAAERNTGKTTTVAHLVERGWGFVTDETVRLSEGAEKVTGYPKPLAIKASGREHVVHLEPFLIPAVEDGPDTFRFVPIGASGAQVVDGGVPHVVVLLRRPAPDNSRRGPVVRRLHPADAVVALMQDTLDAERFGRAAIQLATLAVSSHCVELTVGTPAETVDEIETLFRLDPPDPLDFCVLPSSDAFSAGVVSVAIGDRAVVNDIVSGCILALDPGGTRVWKKLGGWTDDTIDLHGPGIEPFVAELRSLGVLAGAG